MASASSSTEFDEIHEKCRKKVCAVCYRKSSRNLSSREASIIKDNVISNFDLLNPDFPSGVCNGCHLLLSKKAKGDDVIFPLPEDYDPHRAMNRRSVDTCECRICSVAKMDKQEALKLKRKPGRPPAQDEKGTIEVYKICGNCYSKIYRGCNHSAKMCSSRRSKVYNAEKLLDSPTTKERVASRIFDDSPSTSLSTLGNAKKTVLTPTRKSGDDVPMVGSEELLHIQQRLNLSTRQMNKLSHDLKEASPKIIEKGAKQSLYEKNHSLDEFFDLRLLEYTETSSMSGKLKQEWTVICRDLESFIDFVIQERGLQSDSVLIKIGIDGGGGFLKCCLSIFDPVMDGQSRKNDRDFKNSGVKKCFIIGIVPNIPETYFNLKRLWLNVGASDLDRPFTIASDLKLCNILLGLMSHSSLHPCCWCDIEKKEMHAKGTQRTMGSLKNLFWSYFDDGAEKQKAKLYGNVVHLPLFSNVPDDTPVLCVVPPPELHLMTGPVNTMFRALKEAWPQADEWLHCCSIYRESLYGGSFTGNSSRKLLKSTQVLEDISPQNCVIFVKAFEDFNKVVESCFSHQLLPDFLDRIDEFRESYLRLHIPVTPKVHAVLFHFAEFCAMKNQGLGPWSEQTSESVHHDFATIWENYKNP